MLIHCFSCPSSIEVSAEAGVASCPACGALLVWPGQPSPVRAGDHHDRAQRQLCRAVLRYGVTPSTMRGLIEGHEQFDRIYARAAWHIEQRTPALRCAPGHGSRATDAGPLPKPDLFEPWAHDPKQVPFDTRCVATCPRCTGAKKVTCSDCVGIGRVACGYCRGTGRVPGKRGSKNCPSCRGRGDSDCPSCTRGLIGCPTCDKVGRVFAWLEIAIHRSVTARVSADFEVERAHPCVREAADFDRARAELPADLLADTGWRGLLEGWKLPSELVLPIDRRTERALAVRVQALSAPVTSFTYSTRWQQSRVELAGHVPRLVAGMRLEPLRIRAFGSLGAGAMTMAAGLVMLESYLGRSPWFVEYGNGDWLLVLTGIATVASMFALLGYSLPRRARTRFRLMVPLVVLMTVAIGATVAWFSSNPSVAVAERALAEGELDRAAFELNALAELGLDDESSAALVVRLADQRGRRADDARLQAVRDTSSLGAGATVIRAAWHDPVQLEVARELHLQHCAAVLQQAWLAKDPAALGEVAEAAEQIDEHLATRARALAQLASVDGCLARGDFDCAKTRLAATNSEQVAGELAEMRGHTVERLATNLRSIAAVGHDRSRPLEERSVALEQTLQLLKLYGEIAGTEFIDLEYGQLEQTKKKVDASLTRQRVRQERLEARRRAAEERKLQREQAVVERERVRRARASQSLRCRDGTYSSTCSCGGSWRGCCSHHGGVAGCG